VSRYEQYLYHYNTTGPTNGALAARYTPAVIEFHGKGDNTVSYWGKHT